MGKVVLDLETQKAFDEVDGRQFHLLKVSVVGVYDYATDSFKVFEELELGSLLRLLEKADRVIGFNIKGFDYKVLEPYFGAGIYQLPTLDIMEVATQRLGHRVSLDSIASATLGASKTGSGLDAIYYFKQGKMEELKAYCLNDVKLTRDLYEHGRKQGRLRYMKRGELAEFEVTWD
jgi:DEAD/DEAH box helicase domain-containing protein